MTSGNKKYFSAALLNWWDVAGRKNLPWQQPQTPYRVWLSEVMLQQTRVDTVITYFNRFCKKFPTLESLAAASLDEVLQLWSGLGYYARARNLHHTAQILVEQYHGHFPETIEALCQLPGIGRSTAGAILALAMDRYAPILDGNVKRVLCRRFAIPGWPGDSGVNRQLWQLATTLTPRQRIGDYTQAIMDLGATICTRTPQCACCPLADHCLALAQQAVPQYPTPKPRRILPVKEIRMLLLLQQQQILLQQNPPAGLWGGLWVLPQIDMGQNTEHWCLEHLRLSVVLKDNWPVYRHSFSHYHLRIQPCILYCEHSEGVAESGYQWFDLQQPLPAIPTPVSRLLHQLIEQRTNL